MSPAETLAAYRRALEEDGETVVLRRLAVNGAPAFASPPVAARCSGYRAQELLDGIAQGDLRILLLAEDVAASGFPLPFVTRGADRIEVGGRAMTIQSVDDRTRRVAGVLVAYDVRVRG